MTRRLGSRQGSSHSPLLRGVRWTSAAGIGVGNLVPLIGVLFLGWSVPGIFLMYWVAMGVIGPINALRILATLRLDGDAAGEGGGSITRGPGGGGRILAGAWLAAYLAFWAILGVVVIQIATGGFYKGASSTGWNGAPLDVVALGVAALIASQIVAWYLDYVRGGRHLTATPLELLRDPFLRVFVLVGAVAVGGIGTAITGSVGFLVAFIVVETAVEIWYLAPAPVPSPAGPA
jgi:hypothetical protein